VVADLSHLSERGGVWLLAVARMLGIPNRALEMKLANASHGDIAQSPAKPELENRDITKLTGNRLGTDLTTGKHAKHKKRNC